jgi:hypothetical protein
MDNNMFNNLFNNSGSRLVHQQRMGLTIRKILSSAMAILNDPKASAESTKYAQDSLAEVEGQLENAAIDPHEKHDLYEQLAGFYGQRDASAKQELLRRRAIEVLRSQLHHPPTD